jgi:hypothetical protein
MQRDKDSTNLEQIALNTRAIASSVGVAAFGNVSSFTRQAISWAALNNTVTLRH